MNLLHLDVESRFPNPIAEKPHYFVVSFEKRVFRRPHPEGAEKKLISVASDRIDVSLSPAGILPGEGKFATVVGHPHDK